MDKIKLTPRLNLAASMVRNSKTLCDVGTDHGYLPAFLLQQGTIKKAIAADIAQKPLSKAIQTIEKYSLSNSVKTVLSDGLMQINENEVEDISICGMGGETIASILENAQWTKNPKYNFILQPMSRSDELRIYLYNEGFCIKKEMAVVEDKHIYSVMNVVYTGNKAKIDGVFALIGKLPENLNDYAISYINKEINRLQKKVSGLKNASKEKYDTSNINFIIKQLKQFI